MRRLLRHFLLLLLICAQDARALTLTTEEGPPWNMVDPTTQAVVGIAADKVTELMRRANEPYTISVYPWPRAYQLALQDNDTCVFSTTRTPEREALFKWVGPVAKSSHAIFARVSDTRKPKSLDELKPYVVGGYVNDSVGIYLQKKGFKVNFANSDAHNVRLLAQNFIDFWAAGELGGYHLINKSEYKDQIVALFTYNHTSLYLACHLSTDVQRVDRWNRLLQEMERDGTSAAIEKKYR